MFATIGRSWEFAKISYRVLWDFKQLIVFPIFSATAAILVTASFVWPLWQSGTLEQWISVSEQEGTEGNVGMYITLFLFYFLNYFVIIFFNSALTACAMKVVGGEPPSIGYGLRMAGSRIHQIFGWALVSAVIGVVLRAIEGANERAGQFIAAILGSAWTALTFFVVPVIVMEGLSPVAAFKRSLGILKSTWGEALMGNFSLGFLGFLLTVPVVLLTGVLVYGAVQSGSIVLLVVASVLGVGLIALSIATSAAADVVFKAILFNHATGKTLPDNIDTASLSDAFVSRS